MDSQEETIELVTNCIKCGKEINLEEQYENDKVPGTFYCATCELKEIKNNNDNLKTV